MKAFIVLALVVALVAISYGAPAGPGDAAQDAAKQGGDAEDAAKKAAKGGAPDAPTGAAPDAPTGAAPGGDDDGDDGDSKPTPKPHKKHHHHHKKPTKKPGSGENKPPGGKPPGGKPPGGKGPGGKGGKPGDKQVYAHGPKNLNDNETNGIVDTVLQHNKDPKNRRGVFIQTGEALAFNSRYRGQTPCENERGAVYQEGAQHKNFLEDLDNVLGETACTGTEAVETGKAILGKSKSDQGVNPALEGIGLVVDTLTGNPKNLVGKPLEPNRPLLEGVDTLPVPK